MKFYKDNFISIREAARMSQTELAEKLGVSQQAVQQWENGTTKPRPAKVYAAAHALRCSAVDISDLKPEAWLSRTDFAPADPLLRIVTEAWPMLDAEERGRVAGIVTGIAEQKKARPAASGDIQ